MIFNSEDDGDILLDNFLDLAIGEGAAHAIRSIGATPAAAYETRLNESHRRELREGSGLTDETIARNGDSLPRRSRLLNRSRGPAR